MLVRILGHQLKISIDGIRPPVWRRVVVPSDITLARLHQVIQLAFGWWDCHLHEFEVDGATYGIDDGEAWGQPAIDERTTKLAKVAGKSSKFEYTYDFGDNWRHRIEVEDIVALGAGPTHPRCVAGKRSGPPEDVGGPCGYGSFLDALADPAHNDHDDMVEWSGGDFDPEHFDLAEINASLAGLRR